MPASSARSSQASGLNFTGFHCWASLTYSARGTRRAPLVLLVPAGNGVESPVDEHAEALLEEPVAPVAEPRGQLRRPRCLPPSPGPAASGSAGAAATARWLPGNHASAARVLPASINRRRVILRLHPRQSLRKASVTPASTQIPSQASLCVMAWTRRKTTAVAGAAILLATGIAIIVVTRPGFVSQGSLTFPVGHGTPAISLGETTWPHLASDGSLGSWGSDFVGWPVLGLGNVPPQRACAASATTPIGSASPWDLTQPGPESRRDALGLGRQPPRRVWRGDDGPKARGAYHPRPRRAR